MSELAAPLEVRVSGRTLTGAAMVYGSRAKDRAEMFEPGSLQPVYPVTLNLQHDPSRELATTADGTLRLADTSDALNISADLREGSAELELVRRGALRGLSVEFAPLRERRESNGLRVVSRAALPAIGLVDVGSYRTAVELRHAAATLNVESRVQDGPHARSGDPRR